jgi:hypothetical protein
MERSDIIYGVEVKIHCTFLSSFLFSLLLEAIITPVTESPFCKINGTFDKIKKNYGKKQDETTYGWFDLLFLMSTIFR